MIRRGQGSNAATKARKNDGNLLRWSKAVGAVLVVVLALLLIFPQISVGDGSPSETTPTTQTTTTVSEEDEAAQLAAAQAELKKARASYRAARYYRKKADKYHHLLRGRHYPNAHRPMRFTGKLAYEQYRARLWRARAVHMRKLWVQYQQSIRPCVNAGFPRWYCPILKKAARAERRPTWYKDSNLAWIIRHESGFRPHAQNPTSTAYGMFQFLDSTWAGTGIRKTSSPYWQTRAGIRYIKNRYHTPASAVRFWQANHWY